MPLVDHEDSVLIVIEDSVLIVIDAQHGFYGDHLPADDSARAREALDRMGGFRNGRLRGPIRDRFA